MLAASRRFRSLKDLIQTQISNLTSDETPGIVVMLPHLKRLDVYVTLGTRVEPPTPEFMKTLVWILAEKESEGWVSREIDAGVRDSFLQGMGSSS